MLLTTLQLVSLFFGHNDIPCLQMGRLSATHVLFSGSADERLPVLMMGGPKNSTLNAGFLPCRRQTVFRAEFQADIYTDNRAVDRIVNHLLVTGDSKERWIARQDRDLILTFADSCPTNPEVQLLSRGLP